MAISSTPAPTSQLNTATTLTNATSVATGATNTTIRLVAGQILNIVITQTNSAQTNFNLGGQSFKATSPTSSALDTGNLLVQVKSTSPSLQLEILPSKTTSQNLTAQNQTLIQNTLKMLLPNQMPITQALQALSQPSFLQLLPPTLQAQLQNFFNQLLKPGKDLKTDFLKENMQNSGLFLENTLKKKADPKEDLKAKFLQMQNLASQATLSESTIKLSSVLGQAINKITLQQMQLLEHPQSLYITPPIHPDSPIEAIDIEVHKPPSEKNQKYEVLLNIDLPQGTIVAKLVLDNEDSLSAYIWGDTQNLEEQISEGLPTLQQRFAEAAIKTNLVLLSKVKPEAAQKAPQVTLIDIRI